MTDRRFQLANDRSRERLACLVETLRPAQLAVDLGGGWTVASALAHTGFWDRWQAARWTEVLAGRWSADDESVIAAEHLANVALDPYWAGVGAERVGALALDAATELDALIAAAPDATVEALAGTSSAYLLDRHRHRGEHLDQIERALAADRPAAAPVDRSFDARNEASRARLSEFLGGLSRADLALSSGDGSWTVGQTIGHLAFWDRFLAARWRSATAAGPAEQPGAMPHETADLINDALPPMWLAFASSSPEAAVAEAIEAAQTVDRLIAGLPQTVPIEIMLAERPALLDRSIHRNEHLDAMLRVISAHRS
jgi:DinB superfamily